MMKVGITGGIGSGKSTVCRLFARLGVAVYDSDAGAKRLMTEDAELRRRITDRFGAEAYADGTLNRTYLAGRVFSEAQALADLNAIVHPAVWADFAAWAERMEYEEVADFRSELQYRLALALDLEDEEDERSRIFLKLHQGLERTREQLGKGLSTLFASHGDLSADFWDELEELFIMADMGVEAAAELCKRLKSRARAASATTPEELRPLLAAELEEIFRIPRGVVAVNPPEVVLIIGVNGVGKTTTIAKLAYRARMQGKKVLLAAADTFRAAAVEQLGIWAERTGSGFHSKGQNADPAAVAWEAMDIAIRDQYDILFIDTAGRLHTKSNLMDELHKIREVIARKHPGAPHRSILIVDATTGQNALQQTKIFKEAAGIDELILTKLDGTAKGGVAVAVSMQYGIPITYVGLGEKMEDLRPFNGDDFAKALLEQ